MVPQSLGPSGGCCCIGQRGTHLEQALILGASLPYRAGRAETRAVWLLPSEVLGLEQGTELVLLHEATLSCMGLLLPRKSEDSYSQVPAFLSPPCSWSSGRAGRGGASSPEVHSGLGVVGSVRVCSCPRPC